MKSLLKFFMLIVYVVITLVKGYKSETEKLRVCIVEGRGSYRKTERFCPILEEKSNIECVIGVDRLDCIRRIQKGSAHFGVFSSEDLIAARWATDEILVTSELRFHNSPFEYEIVAVVDNEAGIHTPHDLYGSKFCHPGHALENHWTEVLANYFESFLIPKSCDPNLSLAEARIKASSKYFTAACKAGPWVPDPIEDRMLKSRYRNLCDLCYDTYRCGVGDKHWGRRGSLYCLTSGTGDVSWARLDDVRSHFGFSGLPPEADPNEYSFLCPDGHLQPLNATYPCVWVAKPWPVVAAKRTHASEVQNLVSGISHEGSDWQNALLSILETYHISITTLDNIIPIDTFLDQSTGFQSAYSFPSCNPPRSIVYCTTSIIQHIKCSWLQEAAQVYGIEPNLQCIRAETVERCLDDAQHNVVNVVLVDQDNRIKAQKNNNLKPLMYEFSSQMHEKYVVIAIVKKNSEFKDFNDLKGAIACFPEYEGAAYLSVLETIKNKTTTSSSVSRFFSDDSCIWDTKYGNTCKDIYRGEEGALRCLHEKGDVAFLSTDVYKKFLTETLNISWYHSKDRNVFRTICPYGKDYSEHMYEFCFLHWTSRGHLMVHNTTLVRKNEIYNSLRDMDNLFGKNYKSHTLPFSMFGPFDRRNNIMFRDNTEGLRSLSELKRDRMPRLLENVYESYTKGYYPISFGMKQALSQVLLILSAIFMFYVR